MCGIFGYVGHDYQKPLLEAMAKSIQHRGPDEHGIHHQERLGMGMTRLSIIDIKSGQQPIYNSDKSLGIVFNGEIYNYQELRKDLLQRGFRFQTESDTEVVLRLYENLGEACLEKLQGMFAFCIFNTRTKEAFLARDRMGKKPLYYVQEKNTLLFASEIKTLLLAPETKRSINPAAVDAYLSLRYVPGPMTMFENVFKFPAAHFAVWKNEKLTFTPYWQPPVNPEINSDQEKCQNKFDRLFEASVKKRMISEVPLGVFLSSGVDSVAVATAMSRVNKEPVKSFTIGFEWSGDELEGARAVAKHLGCDHHESICTKKDIEAFPHMIWHLDEPIGDAITLPMYLLAKNARKHVTVVLSGEGADEVLGGYFFHKVLKYSHLYSQLVPRTLHNMALPMVNNLPGALLNQLFDYPANLGEKGRKKFVGFYESLAKDNLADRYLDSLCLFDQSDKKDLYRSIGPLAGVTDQYRQGFKDFPFGKSKLFLNNLLSLQHVHWLADDILNKTDKMTMAHSIEGRTPFMDHELVEFLYSTPEEMRLSWTQNKVLLRNYLAKHLPSEMALRRKKAFYIPIEKYFATKFLKDLMQDCLSDTTIKKRGYFNLDYIKNLRSQINRGEFVYDKQFYSLLALEVWNRLFIDNDQSLLSASSLAPSNTNFVALPASLI